MLNPIKLMKIFEVAWLVIAGISLTMGIYQISTQSLDGAAYPYLFLVFGLAILMFFIKRSNRKFMEKRQAEEVNGK